MSTWMLGWLIAIGDVCSWGHGHTTISWYLSAVMQACSSLFLGLQPVASWAPDAHRPAKAKIPRRITTVRAEILHTKYLAVRAELPLLCACIHMYSQTCGVVGSRCKRHTPPCC